MSFRLIVLDTGLLIKKSLNILIHNCEHERRVQGLHALWLRGSD